MKAAGDHQVEHEPEVVVEADGDAFADAAQSGDCAALRLRVSGGTTVRRRNGLAMRTR